MPEFVDTNVFLRYLTNDVANQADAVESLLREAEDGNRDLVTTPLVVAEIVWTLESYYELSRDRIMSAVLAILATPGLDVEEADVVLQAVIWYEEKNVGFADAYHAAWMLNRGLSIVHTFDRRHFSRFERLVVNVPT